MIGFGAALARLRAVEQRANQRRVVRLQALLASHHDQLPRALLRHPGRRIERVDEDVERVLGGGRY